jgi:hypothetical protein
MTFSADEARLAIILPGARCECEIRPGRVRVAMSAFQYETLHHPKSPTLRAGTQIRSVPQRRLNLAASGRGVPEPSGSKKV